MPNNFLELFITVAGYIIGLGAVTVIDLHGFLGRSSSYWTEATTRTHKVTKPLIWIGTFLVLIGSYLYYKNLNFPFYAKYHFLIFVVLILNGLFLTFKVSPHLIEKERLGKQTELLSRSWQTKITLSFIVSFTGWWSTLLMLIYSIVA